MTQLSPTPPSAVPPTETAVPPSTAVSDASVEPSVNATSTAPSSPSASQPAAAEKPTVPAESRDPAASAQTPDSQAIAPARPDTEADGSSSTEAKKNLGENDQQPNPRQETAETATAQDPRSLGSLDLTVNDLNGLPIPNLALKVAIKKNVVFKGKTDSKGKVATIKDLPISSIFEIRVKREKKAPPLKTDDEEGYKLAAIGKIEAAESYAGLTSPKTRFEFSTETHDGTPGGADKKKTTIAASHNQVPAKVPEFSGNPQKAPVLKSDRNDKGLPKAVVEHGLRDWLNRNTIISTAPAQTTEDIERVKRLIEFAEKQATWEYDSKTVTATYIQRMRAKTFEIPESKEKDGFQNSVGQCTKYVKIALWIAGYGPADEAIGNQVSPAREMGPPLVKAGFRDITSQIPDARWAAPGDVIVYQRKSDPSAAGHIDIRTYDGYIADFFGTYLPISKFKVIGVYRKYFDPLPEKRVRAFLMMIASREATANFEHEGYAESFKTLPGQGRKKFTSFARHPFEGTDVEPSASGAYGITWRTWKNYSTKLLQLSDKEMDFTPTTQDRIAVAIMEQTQNALGHVRKGDIEKAAYILGKTDQWASMPAGKQGRGFTVAKMAQAFEGFLKNL
jgi:muramidase (phage lysozyme)